MHGLGIFVKDIEHSAVAVLQCAVLHYTVLAMLCCTNNMCSSCGTAECCRSLVPALTYNRYHRCEHAETAVYSSEHINKNSIIKLAGLAVLVAASYLHSSVSGLSSQ